MIFAEMRFGVESIPFAERGIGVGGSGDEGQYAGRVTTSRQNQKAFQD